MTAGSLLASPSREQVTAGTAEEIGRPNNIDWFHNFDDAMADVFYGPTNSFRVVGGLAGSGPARLIDAATGDTDAQDWWFGNIVDPGVKNLEAMQDRRMMYGAASDLTSGLGQFILAAAAGGPAGVAIAEYGKRISPEMHGDKSVAQIAALGGVAAGTGFVATAVPLSFGNTLLQRFGFAALAGPGLGVSSRVAEKAMLDAFGYDEEAQRIRPLDPKTLAIESAFAFTLAGYAHVRDTPIPIDIDLRELGPAMDVIAGQADASLDARSMPAPKAKTEAEAVAERHAHQETLDAADRAVREGGRVENGEVVAADVALARDTVEPTGDTPDSVASTRRSEAEAEQARAEANAEREAIQAEAAKTDAGAKPEEPLPLPEDGLPPDLELGLRDVDGEPNAADIVNAKEYITALRAAVKTPEEYERLFSEVVTCAMKGGG